MTAGCYPETCDDCGWQECSAEGVCLRAVNARRQLLENAPILLGIDLGAPHPAVVQVRWPKAATPELPAVSR